MKHRIYLIIATGILLLGPAGTLQARLHLGGVFSDNMVLQRDKPVAVWGTADPEAAVEVRFGSQRVKGRADADGNWSLTLSPMAANATPRELTVRCGRERKVFRDVLVGEVWIASGQSNMEYNMGPVWRSGSTGKVDRPERGPSVQEEEFRRADLPLLRTLIVEKVLDTDSLPTCGWQRITPETIAPVSAAAYFFAKNLIDSLQVPVGILETCWGGTRIETWLPLEAVEADPVFSPGLKDGSYDGEPVGLRYDRMVREMVPYTLRGMIWYQGESNLIAGNTDKYAAMQALLVRSWRKAWGDDFPFYFVQLAPYRYSQRRGDRHVSTWEDLPRFWAQQEQSLSLIPHSGMAMVCDLVDNLSDIHPTYKWELGRRLALQALIGTYGRGNLVADGPRMVGVSAEGPVVTVEFDQPLKTSDGQLPRHFRIAGSTGRYYEPTDIRVEGSRVVLSNPERVKEPAEVRYAWDEAAVTNLCGLQGLPVRQFSASISAAPEKVANPAWDDTSKTEWGPEFERVGIPSPTDGAVQQAIIRRSPEPGRPLVVSLHTWSGGYDQKDPVISQEAVELDWNYIHPDFRGPNWTPQALGSPLAIRDIEDAIRWAVLEMKADPEEVHVVGVSGGGYATLYCYMNLEYPVKSFSAWAPISDIEAWYWQTMGAGRNYWEHIRRAIPSGDGIDTAEAGRRSPLYQSLPEGPRREVPLHIYEGVHDGYKGSVPITHTLLMYDRVVGEMKYKTPDMQKILDRAAKDPDLVSRDEMLDLVTHQQNPDAGSSRELLGRKIHLERSWGPVSVTIFEGAHEQLSGALRLILSHFENRLSEKD